MYKKYLKRLIDIVMSLGGIVCLSWLYLILIVAIRLDSPGPILFRQKRVGKKKRHFQILKFRTMRTDTPHDMPTHLLQDPDQFITRTGRFLRKTSLDRAAAALEYPERRYVGSGAEAALWNQFDLIEERDKYGANDIRPGLTGWAQTHGRDELEIEEKAKLDGYYAEHLSFGLDVKCFLRTIGAVLRSDGVVEGGTGRMAQERGEEKKVS